VLPVCEWLSTMIGPGGLLLVVSHLFCSPRFNFNFMGEVGKKKYDVKKYFLGGSHTENCWRCS
jgi:hypothetical protein